jgi:SAM-dependent methyltransferase
MVSAKRSHNWRPAAVRVQSLAMRPENHLDLRRAVDRADVMEHHPAPEPQLPAYPGVDRIVGIVWMATRLGNFARRGQARRVDSSPEPDDAAQFWEDRYRSTERAWSGRVNARLPEVAAELPAGLALDLGCGEGADALWLAERGWHVVAVDVSATALQRATEAAAAQHLLERIDFQRHDLNETFPEGMFDLVSAQYLHSPARLEREAVLRQAADRVTAGGVLLIVDHAEPPPWAQHHDHCFPGIEDVLASLRLDTNAWTRVRTETVERETVGPDGEPATLKDNVIVLRRAD